MRNFYLLEVAWKKGAISLSLCEYGNTNYYDFFRGELLLDGPLFFKRNLGQKYYDYILGGDVCLNLFHNRFFDALKANSITGYEQFPAVIGIKEPNIEYSCLIIKGRVHGEDDKKGDLINLGPKVPGAPPVIVKKGLFFDESTWDGSDFCILDNKAHIIVSERVRQIILDLKITNIKTIPIEEYQVSIETLSIGKPELRIYFLDKLAAMG